MIEHPYRTVQLPSGALALVPDFAKSRAIAAEIEARERAAARQAARPAIVKALAALAPGIVERLGR